MPAISALSLSGTSTTYTFAPRGTNGSQAVWCNGASGVPAHSPRLTISVVEAKNPSGAARVIGQLILPKTATVDGVVQVVRSNRINFDLNFAQTSTDAERLDDLATIASLFANANFKTMVEKIEPAY